VVIAAPPHEADISELLPDADAASPASDTLQTRHAVQPQPEAEPDSAGVEVQALTLHEQVLEVPLAQDRADEIDQPNDSAADTAPEPDHVAQAVLPTVLPEVLAGQPSPTMPQDTDLLNAEPLSRDAPNDEPPSSEPTLLEDRFLDASIIGVTDPPEPDWTSRLAVASEPQASAASDVHDNRHEQSTTDPWTTSVEQPVAKPRPRPSMYWVMLGAASFLVLLVSVLLGTQLVGTVPTKQATAANSAPPASSPRQAPPAAPSASAQLGDAATAMPMQTTAAPVTTLCDAEQLPASAAGSAAAHLRSGLAAFDARRYDQAISEYTRALQLDPRLAEAYINRGQSYHLKEHYACAIEDYTQALELDPPVKLAAAAYNFRGNAYAYQEQHVQAIEDYRRSIQLDPDYVAAYFNLGLVYHVRHEYERAIQSYTQALDRDASYAPAYFYRGLARKNNGSQEENAKAIADFMKVLELSDDPQLQQKAQHELRALNAMPAATATS
jgi:Flp pilus assembly protein TadD